MRAMTRNPDTEFAGKVYLDSKDSRLTLTEVLYVPGGCQNLISLSLVSLMDGTFSADQTRTLSIFHKSGRCVASAPAIEWDGQRIWVVGGVHAKRNRNQRHRNQRHRPRGLKRRTANTSSDSESDYAVSDYAESGDSGSELLPVNNLPIITTLETVSKTLLEETPGKTLEMEEGLQDRAGAIDRAGVIEVKMELESTIAKGGIPEKGGEQVQESEQESDVVKSENGGGLVGKVLWTEFANHRHYAIITLILAFFLVVEPSWGLANIGL